MFWFILGIIGLTVSLSYRIWRRVGSGILLIFIWNIFWILGYWTVKLTLAGTIHPITGLLVMIGVLIGFIDRMKRCLRKISTAEMGESQVTVQGIILEWGKPVRAKGPGLCWLWSPVQTLGRLVPTIAYKLEMGEFLVHTEKEEEGKDEEGETTKPVTVGATVHPTLPRAWEKYKIKKEDIPSIWRNLVKEFVTEKVKEGDQEKEIEFGILEGEDLLVKWLYYSMDADKPFHSDDMATFFHDAVVDALRGRMVNYTYTEARENATRIEEEAKHYMLTDPANLFVKCGIPPENLDISIISMRSTDRIEESLYAEELARISGTVDKRRVKALIDTGVEKNIAGALVKAEREAGERIDVGALAQLGIALAFLGINPPFGSQALTGDQKKKLIGVLATIPEEQREKLLDILSL